ncbi:MAG TPA: hypothetical protein DD640_08345, partial [Clostridiales bacterium]|nr:hypothetical protein [Clostridiales bacterium]
MIVIGLDIGTTSISGLAADLETGAVIESATIPNDSRIRSDHEWESCQDPEKIWSLAAGLLDRLIDAHAPVAAIGLTGQMHGIVYLDQDGQAVSPLYTWQDQRGSLPDSSGVSAAEQLARTTGCFLAAGYGSATHAYNCRQHLVPNRACCFTTIQDYLGLRLTRRRKPLVHASNAASFGLYALTEGRFDLSALRKAGLDASFFPETTNETLLLGYYRKGN